MNTKEKIIKTSLRLFNERGTREITTNHIAKASGISPGNLYYHFRSKEQIIRALFKLFKEKKDSLFDSRLLMPQTFGDVEDYFNSLTSIQWDYRFLFRELNALLTRDRQLRRDFILYHKLRYEEQKA